MSMSRPPAVPRVPTLPRGEEIASYATYLEAQQAVDYLSDEKFAVELVTIVGTDLRMVERVTGRLSYSRVAIAGLASGAWFGLFVGLLLAIFGGNMPAIFAAIGLGAGFGLLFSVLSYALTRGKRDFTSSSQIVASSYAVLCAPERAGEARRMLSGHGDGTGVRNPANPTWGVPGQAPTAPGATPAPAALAEPGAAPEAVPTRPVDPRWTTPTGEPRYGAMRPTAPAAPPEAPAATPETPAEPEAPPAERDAR